jgi:hypothetical protein
MEHALAEANGADDLPLLRRLVGQADQLPPDAVIPAAVARACNVLVRVSDDEEQWRPVPHLARGTDRPGWHDRTPTRALKRVRFLPADHHRLELGSRHRHTGRRGHRGLNRRGQRGRASLTRHGGTSG